MVLICARTQHAGEPQTHEKDGQAYSSSPSWYPLLETSRMRCGSITSTISEQNRDRAVALEQHPPMQSSPSVTPAECQPVTDKIDIRPTATLTVLLRMLHPLLLKLWFISIQTSARASRHAGQTNVSAPYKAPSSKTQTIPPHMKRLSFLTSPPTRSA